MKEAVFVLAVLLVSCTSCASPAEEIPAGFNKWALWTGGTQLRGANIWQRIVVLKYDGSEFLGNGYIGPPYKQSDFDALAALGANYVNLSHPGVFTERPPYIPDEKVVENLDSMIAMATRADLFAVITFRTGPGRNDFTFYRDDDWFKPEDLIENLWGDEEAQTAWVEMWRYTAERYRDNPVVVGYDLLCEPNANEMFDDWDGDHFYAVHSGTVYDWNRWYPRAVQAIREVDTETPVLVGADAYSTLSWLAYVKPADAEKLVYTFHQYLPDQYTHQEPGGAYSYPGQADFDYNGEEDAINRSWLETYLSQASNYAEKYGVVVAVNEYGVARWAPGAAEFMYDEMEIFEQLGLNYSLWVWDPVWQPWNERVNFMSILYGEDPANMMETENELFDVVTGFWSFNTVRPSRLRIGTLSEGS
jgi:hypothetical protein